MDEENSVDVRKTFYPDALLRAIESIDPKYHRMSEVELKNKLRPSLKMYEVRQAFWEEFAQAQHTGKKMRMWRIYEGKVTKTNFYETVLSNPLRMAWITSPMVVYEDRVKACLEKATERYEELIAMDINITKRRKNELGEWEEYEDVCPKKAAVFFSSAVAIN